MKHSYPLEHLGDGELLSNNEAIWRRRRHCTAEGLAHLAEIDERRLYLPPSGDQLDLAASDSPAPERVEMLPEEPAQTPVSPARVMPLSPGRFGVQFTMSQKARDHYEYSRALLSHELPKADLATVSEMAYAALGSGGEMSQPC